MKKLAMFAVSALAMSACGKQAPSSAPDSATSGAPAMISGMSGMSASASATAVTTGDSTGVVKAVDASVASVTLDHQAIPAVGWPAMTMTFKAAPPSLLDGIKAGDKVDFTVRIEGDNTEVTAIRKR